MNKEFVTYKQALALTKLGFVGPAMGLYYEKGKKLYYGAGSFSSSRHENIIAPLYSEAFKWFRDEHNLWIEIHVEDNVKLGEQRYYWTIFGEYKSLEGNSWIRSKKDSNGVMYNTYEEAQDACLDKLIELVKNDNT